MARIQIESGARNAQTDSYNGHKVEVATGYDARSDKWPIHVYVWSKDGKVRNKIEGQWHADSCSEAFEAGFGIAMSDIDSRA